MIRYHQDKNGYLVYRNTRTDRTAIVSDDDLLNAIEICEDWHGGPGSPCYRLIEYDFSYRNLRSVLSELRYVVQIADQTSARIDGDDYLDLLMTIQDLEGIVARIDAIAS